MVLRAPDFDEMEIRLKNRILVDGRNLYEPERLHSAGWIYEAIGR
ncbi:hypothetical protein [Desulfobotulus mexicanus]|nr:hypothetical protein [Desulfobotulus mexicanus]